MNLLKSTLNRSKIILLMILLVSLNIYNGLSQPGKGISFRFSSAAGNVAFPAGSTTVAFPVGNQDDNALLSAPAGMNVKFAGRSYQQIVVSTNGWLALVPGSVVGVPASLSAGGFLNTNSLSTYAGAYPIIAPFWDDLACTSYQYNWVGNQLWVRWSAKIDKTNATAGFLFWVRIDGTTGAIDYYYTATAYTISGLPSASIGLAGICTGDYYSYNFNTLPTFADSTLETSNISSKPINTTYTFTPYQWYDDCATALDLSPITSTCTYQTFNINNARTSGSVMACSPLGTDTADIWFKFIKPVGVLSVTVTTAPSTPACLASIGTSVEVFSACGGASLGCSSTSLANPAFGEITLARPCTAETLFVRVTDDNDSLGSFNLCVNFPSGGATGVDCATAIPVCPPLPYNNTGLTTAGSVDNYHDSILCQSPYSLGQDYLFSYTPAVTQCVIIYIDGTGLNSYPGLFLLDGCPNDTDNSTCVASAINTSNGDTIANITLTGGHTYYIMVDNNAPLAGSTSMPFNFHIRNSVTAAPGNDACGTATSLGTIPSNASCTWTPSYTTQCATPSPIAGYPPPGCGNFVPSLTNDIWFSFTAGFTGVLLVNSQGIGVNPVTHGGMAIYSGSCGGLTLIGCAGDSVGIPFMPSLAINVNNASSYYIRYWSATYLDPGTFQLCFQANCSPPNDLPVNATVLPLATPMLGDNTCSTGAAEMVDPVNCTSAPINTVWYSITVPPSGQVAVRISQLSLLDAAVAAYLLPAGPLNAPVTYTFLACNDDIIFAPPCPICGMTGDNDAAIQFNALPGSTAYIVVDGEFSNVGSFYITAIEGTLTSTFPPVYRKDCGNPEFICSNGNYYLPNGGVGSDGNICDFQNLACSGGTTTSEVGSAWLQFTVANGSQLGFTITPNDSAAPVANYNFYLWDITGIANICTQLSSTAPVRCNTSAGTGKTGCRNPISAAYADIIAAQATPHTYMLYVQNLTSANDDEGVPGTNTGFTLNWDIYSGGVNIGTTQILGVSSTCTWSGPVINNDYQNQPNWKGVGSCPPPLPSCTTDVFISAATQLCTITGNSYAKNLTINAGGTLVIGPTGNLHICGDYVNNGTLTAQAGATITIEGNVNQSISGLLTGANSFANLVILKPSGIATLNSNLDVRQNFTTSNTTSIFKINGKYMKVGENFTNSNGTTTFTGIGGSTVEFNGSINQFFTNQNGSISLNRVLMNKTGGRFFLNGAASNMNIDSLLTLTSGIIVTRSLSSLEVNMRNYVPASITGHNTLSYIDGKLRRKIANGAFSSPPIPASYDFPLGDSTLIPNGGGGYELANIYFTTATLVYDLLSTFNHWTAGPPANGPFANECLIATYSNKPIFDNGYWTFKRSTTNVSGRYNVSLFNTGYTNNTGAGWTVAKADSALNPNLITSWKLQGNCVITSTPGNTQRSNLNPVPGNDTSSFDHYYATAQTELVLPVELLYFNAEPVGEHVLCTWETASETNNDHFSVERSLDGKTFEEIGSVKGYGSGTSTQKRKYTYADEEVCNNIIYYRLRQVDIDNNFAYTDAVAVNCAKNKNGISIYPNPGQSSIAVSFDEPVNSTVVVKFIDYTGRVVLSRTLNATKGFNQYQISIEDLSVGLYNVSIESTVHSGDKKRQTLFIKN